MNYNDAFYIQKVHRTLSNESNKCSWWPISHQIPSGRILYPPISKMEGLVSVLRELFQSINTIIIVITITTTTTVNKWNRGINAQLKLFFPLPQQSTNNVLTSIPPPILEPYSFRSPKPPWSLSRKMSITISQACCKENSALILGWFKTYHRTFHLRNVRISNEESLSLSVIREAEQFHITGRVQL